MHGGRPALTEEEEPKRRAMTPARMKRIWEREGGVCWICDKPVPMRGGDLVRYDHRIPFEVCRHDEDWNIFPIHRDPCDLWKTAQDQEDIARARRRRNKAAGIQTRKKAPIANPGFPKGVKRPLQSQGFRRDGPKRKIPSRGFCR